MEQRLIKAGYKRFDAGIWKEFTDFFYQKRFTDAKGIKYFIEFHHYPGKEPVGALFLEESWMAELNVNEPNATFQLHRVDDAEDVEARIEAVWLALGSPYYET
jgi:hypothetical protein